MLVFRHRLAPVRRPFVVLVLAGLLAGITGAVVEGSAAGGNSRLPTWWSKLQLVSAQKIGLNPMITLRPKFGMKMKLSSRTGV